MPDTPPPASRTPPAGCSWRRWGAHTGCRSAAPVAATPPPDGLQDGEEKRRVRKDRKQSQKILNELEFEKFLDELDGEKEELKIFRTIEPEGVNELEDKGEWEEIELAVDSGATETVVGEGDLLSIELKEGAASRRGTEYEVANGVRIPNLGEKKFGLHRGGKHAKPHGASMRRE